MPPIPVVASFCGGAATLDRGCHISSIVGFVLFAIELILASIIASYHEARVTPNIIGSIVGVAACVLLILAVKNKDTKLMLIHMVASVMASVIHLVALIMDIIVLVEFARTVNLIGSNITGEIIFLFIVVILLMVLTLAILPMMLYAAVLAHSTYLKMKVGEVAGDAAAEAMQTVGKMVD